MRFAAITPAYNEAPLVRGCIESYRPFVEKHIFTVGEKPYFGDKIYEDDGTAEIAEDLGAEVIKGVWDLDHGQRNTAIRVLQEYDWIIVADVDMWMCHSDVEKLIDLLGRNEEKAYIIRQTSYWKDVDHVIVDDDFKPVIAIKPDVRFTHIGNIGSPFGIIEDFCIHHINWCAPKDIHKKVLTYSHAPEFDGQRWYEDHYEGWTESDTAVLPNNIYKIKRQSLPNELKEYLVGCHV